MIKKQDIKPFLIWFVLTELFVGFISLLFGGVSIFLIFIALFTKNLVFSKYKERDYLVPTGGKEEGYFKRNIYKTWVDASKRPLDIKFFTLATIPAVIDKFILSEIQDSAFFLILLLVSSLLYFVILYNWILRSKLR